MKRVFKNNRGFTLVELLAVICIMAILLIVAVPAINALLFNSRAKMYVQSAGVFLNTAKNFVIDGTLEPTDFDVTYYIHINNLSDEEITPSPFAPWNQAYVVITHNEDDSYDYYWVSADKSGFRIDLTADEKIVKGSVYQGETTVNNRQPIGKRRKIAILDSNGYMQIADPYKEMTRPEAQKCFSFKDLSDTETMLSYYNKDCGLDLVIPAVIDGRKVTSIYQYTFNNMGLNSVYIPETVTTIGARAFAYNNLKSLYIPSSVTQLDSEAFLSNELTELVLPEGLKTIGSSCFKDNHLTEAIVPDSVTSLGACSYCDNPIPNPSFLYVKTNGVIDYSKVRGYIGDLTEFSNKKFIIPAVAEGTQLKRIENSSFASMSLSGWEVVIPDTVTYIGSSAFSGSGISKVNIPDGVTTIGASAFYSNKLTELHIPNSVTSIGSLAFNANQVQDQEQAWIYKRTASGIDYSTLIGYAGAKRNDITIPSEKNGVTLTTLGTQAFYVSYFTGTLRIPPTITSIGSLAFSLNSVSYVDNGDGNLVPGFVYARKSDGSFDKTNIFSYASTGTNLVTIPSDVKTISPSAFYYSGIKGVVLNEGLETIGSGAFQKCKLGSELVIPSTVKSIGNNAFRKEIVYTNYNSDLVKIINKTGKVFDWKLITGGPSDATFVSGTVENWFGNIEVVTE